MFKVEIFHCFLECSRLTNLFSILKLMFLNFGEIIGVFGELMFLNFSTQSFILGPRYRAAQRSKCQLLNFLIGQAKRAIYISKMLEGIVRAKS